MKFSTVIAVALASVVLTACTSHANKDAMKPAMKDHKMTDTMKKDTMMKDKMSEKEKMMKDTMTDTMKK